MTPERRDRLRRIYTVLVCFGVFDMVLYGAWYAVEGGAVVLVVLVVIAVLTVGAFVRRRSL